MCSILFLLLHLALSKISLLFSKFGLRRDIIALVEKLSDFKTIWLCCLGLRSSRIPRLLIIPSVVLDKKTTQIQSNATRTWHPWLSCIRMTFCMIKRLSVRKVTSCSHYSTELKVAVMLHTKLSCFLKQKSPLKTQYRVANLSSI